MKRRAPRIFVLHAGERFSLYELARRVGVTYSVIRRRYADGERGEVLIRPIRNGKPSEHQAIVTRIKNCGQRNWRTDGGSVL